MKIKLKIYKQMKINLQKIKINKIFKTKIINTLKMKIRSVKIG